MAYVGAQLAAADETLGEIFDQFDADGDGFLDMDEVRPKDDIYIYIYSIYADQLLTNPTIAHTAFNAHTHARTHSSW
jgi:hypothetical protein